MPPLPSLESEPFLSFVGGLNTKGSRLLGPTGDTDKDRLRLQPNELIFNENWEYTRSGAAKVRDGYAKLTSAGPSGTNAVTAMFELRQQAGTRYLYAIAGGSIFEYSAGSWTDRGTITTAGKQHWYAQYDDRGVFINDTDNAYTITGGGSVAALGGGSPGGPRLSAVAVYRNRTWLAKDLTLYGTQLGTDPTTAGAWTGAGSVNLPVRIGGRSRKITGLVPYYNQMVILLDAGIARLTGTGGDAAETAIIPMNYHIGALHQGTVVTAGNDVYFVSERGVHSLITTEAQSLFGDISEDYVSARIEPTFQEFLVAQLANTAGAILPRKNQVRWVGTITGTTNTRAIVFDYYHRAWTVFTNYPFASITNAYAGASVERLIGGGNDGNVYVLDSGGTDDGARIRARMRKVVGAMAPDLIKTWRRTVFFADPNGGVVTVAPTFDYGARTAAPTDITLIGTGGKVGDVLPITLAGQEVSPQVVKHTNYGRYMTLEFQTLQELQALIHGGVAYYEPRRLVES